MVQRTAASFHREVRPHNLIQRANPSNTMVAVPGYRQPRPLPHRHDGQRQTIARGVTPIRKCPAAAFSLSSSQIKNKVMRMPLIGDDGDSKPQEKITANYYYTMLIDNICNFRWNIIGHDELLRIAQAYYYFSVQFRENLEIACGLHPDDAKLRLLRAEECQTDNLSPWPCIAMVGEKLDHDEFIRRALLLNPEGRCEELDRLGLRYLAAVRATDWLSRAKSISSYENDGLSRVFSAILRAPDWRGPALRAFRFFLERHIEFDSDAEAGHGSLSRHLEADDSVVPLWAAFHDLLAAAAPRVLPDSAGTARAMAQAPTFWAERLDPPLIGPKHAGSVA